MESLTYSRNGEYLIPNLTLPEQPEMTPGRYGLLRRAYLQDHRPILYSSLTLKTELHRHLLQIEQTANRRLEQLMTELAAKNPPPEKAARPAEWERHMNSLKQQAEDLLLTELIYS